MENLKRKFFEKARLNFDEHVYETWIKPISIELNENSFQIITPNQLFKDWLEENYLEQIKNIVYSLMEREIQIFLTVSKNKNITTYSQESFHPELIQRYTFENFIKGKSNEFAYAAAKAVVDNLGGLYNPLLIYSNVGLGKTHLIMAIGHEVYRKYPHKKVVYYSSEKFMNELISSIRFEKMHEFREKFRNADLLLIDDIQFISGKTATQEEFFNTFNTLYESKKQIVITSDKFPKQLQNIEDRLKNRFEWGLTVDIQPPEYETRIAILKNKAWYHKIDLPDDIAEFIATNICTNIREMEGALIKLLAYSSLTKKPLDINLAKDILKDFIPQEETTISVEQIQKTVSEYFQIKITDLKSQKKLKTISIPRQIAIFLSRKYTQLSLNDIGNKFGGKDHSTIIHSINKIKKMLDNDNSIKKHIDNIEKMLTKNR
ncbi:MAG: chromosomal replication initiator protein DnaA [Proteobacteria bacterium]|nr:chromosomal replication initiator protein DnaA [Pseudomonadota bacterium]